MTIDQLSTLAKAASAGPWRSDERSPTSFWIVRDTDGDANIPVCHLGANHPPAVQRANAAYIAATSPDAVLGLIAALHEAQAEIAACHGKPEGALPGWGWEGDHWIQVPSTRPLVGLMVYLADDHDSWLWDASYTDDGGEKFVDVRGDAPTPREAMRQAEAAAKAEGWMP